MKDHKGLIPIESSAAIEFIDITERVKKEIAKSGVKNGIAVIGSNHTTACVRISENCARLTKDMISFLEALVPQKKYLHDEDTVDDRPNARGHIMALFLNSSECVSVENGELSIGNWQSIFFVELDGPRNNRSVQVKVVE